MTFRVDGEPEDVRDLGNDLRSAISTAQRNGRHALVQVAGPTIRPVCPGCSEPCGQCAE